MMGDDAGMALGVAAGEVLFICEFVNARERTIVRMPWRARSADGARTMGACENQTGGSAPAGGGNAWAGRAARLVAGSTHAACTLACIHQ